MDTTKTPGELFKKRLNELMLSNEINKNQLAEKTGISATMIGKYTSGKSFPHCENGARIADVFCVSLDYLFGLSDEEKPIKKDDSLRLETFEDLYRVIFRMLCMVCDSHFERIVENETIPDGGIDMITGEFIDEFPCREVLRLDFRNKDFVQFYKRIEDARKLAVKFGNEVADMAISRIHEEMKAAKLPTKELPF